MNRSILLLILTSVTMTSLAQIVLKVGMNAPEVGRAMAGGIRPSLVVHVLLHPWVFCGLVLYGSAAMVWLMVLSKIDVSQAYPFVGLGFVVTTVLAWAFLGEAVTVMRLIGTLLIVSGVVVLSRS